MLQSKRSWETASAHSGSVVEPIEYAFFEEDFEVDAYIKIRQQDRQNKRKRTQLFMIAVTLAISAAIILVAHHYYTKSTEMSLNDLEDVELRAIKEMEQYKRLKRDSSREEINAMKTLEQDLQDSRLDDAAKDQDVQITIDSVKQLQKIRKENDPRAKDGAVHFLLREKRMKDEDSVLNVVIDRIKEAAASAFSGEKQRKFFDWARAASIFASGPTVNDGETDEALLNTLHKMESHVKRVITRIKQHKVPSMADLRNDDDYMM